MTDTDKIKRLAEAANWMKGEDDVFLATSVANEHADDILDLIAENKRFARQYAELAGQVNALMDAYPNPAKELDRLKRVIAERDEAVALLREWDRVGIDGTCGSNLEDSTENFLARIDATE